MIKKEFKIIFFDLEFKSNKEAADFFGVSQGFMSLVTSGRKKANDEMLRKAGYERVTIYRKIEEQ